jgi:hypothetical protein
MTLIRAKTKKFALSKTILASALFFTLIINVAQIQTQDLSIFAYGPAELLQPLGVGDIISANKSASQDKNNISDIDSDITGNDDTDHEIDNCVMPPCPPGQACIQSCP